MNTRLQDQGEVDGKGEVAEEGEVDEAQPANEGPATGGLTVSEVEMYTGHLRAF
jgi:hypothetical protein